MLAIGFGSRCRGDADYSSDSDILLIGNDWDEVTKYKTLYAASGHSVSTCLADNAAHLTKKGNLFFKHIFSEGIILSGSKVTFENLASQWVYSTDYITEAKQNLDLLEILGYIPKTNMGILAAVDILVTSSRNILIRRLASLDYYAFSWFKIFQESNRRGIIRGHDIPILLQARILKNKYRQGLLPRISYTYFNALIESASRACGTALNLRFAQPKALMSLPEKIKNGTYKQLRAFELLCAQYPADSQLTSVRKIIKEPSYFCAHGPGASIFIEAEIGVKSKEVGNL